MKIRQLILVAMMAAFISTGIQQSAEARDAVQSSNAIREEHRLLEHSLADLERYLVIQARTGSDPTSEDSRSSGASLLARSMQRNGLAWKDSPRVRPYERWWLAYELNPKARPAMISIWTREVVAKKIEEVVSRDRAFASGSRKGHLSAASRKEIRKWIAIGKRLAGKFETYYPRPTG